MTPEQHQGLAVILDHARELFGDETAARMQRAVEPDIEHAVIRVAEVFENERKAVSKGSAPYASAFLWALVGSEVVNAMAHLSPAETFAAASAPHPQEAPPTPVDEWEERHFSQADEESQ